MTADKIRNLLRYEPESGHFFWRAGGRRIRLDRPAGATDSKGYVVIRVAGKLYKAHRLAWLYVHGSWPSTGIDHINRRPGDNRIENLRCVPQSLNAINANRKSSVGAPGVSWRKDRHKWVARLKVNGKTLNLGCFDCVDDAIMARQDAEARIFAQYGKP